MRHTITLHGAMLSISLDSTTRIQYTRSCRWDNAKPRRSFAPRGQHHNSNSRRRGTPPFIEGASPHELRGAPSWLLKCETPILANTSRRSGMLIAPSACRHRHPSRLPASCTTTRAASSRQWRPRPGGSLSLRPGAVETTGTATSRSLFPAFETASKAGSGQGDGRFCEGAPLLQRSALAMHALIDARGGQRHVMLD
jgi:hypothetical protein